MKKRITSLLVFFVLLLLSNLSFAQGTNSKGYDVNKANFWKQYLQYKENLKTNPNIQKPVDPSGLFRIDEQNNFSDVGSSEKPVVPNNESQGPWINPPQSNTAASYVWAQTTGTYTAVAGTTLGTVSNDDNTFNAIPIGFNFNYDGTSYSTVDINANGYIKFGTISGSSYPNILSLQTQIFAAFNNDLRANNTTSTLQYVTTGSVGSRVMTIQWANYGCYSGGWDGSDFSFQIKLYETTNTLQIVFGANPTIVNPGALTIQCGINNLTTDYNCRTTATDWTATTAGASNTAANTFTAAIKPPSGQIWTWSPLPMTYSSSTTVQLQSGVNVPQNTNNNQIIQVQVVTSGGSAAITATSFSLGTTGSTNPATDITNAKIYFTGNSSAFSTANLFGTQSSPSGTFSISGSQALALGTNYFWVTYDVPSGAVVGDLLDAQCNSITIGTPQIPTVTAPAGNRPISAQIQPFCGTINIPGTYPSLTAFVNDLNIVGLSCPTIVNVAPGYTESNVNLLIICPVNPPNAINTLTIRKNGAGVNPLLTAGVGVSATLDGIITLNGVNYVTFDGIDVQENPANVTNITQMEWGYGLLRADGTHGCQNDKIMNCNITLNKTNVASYGIYSGLINAAGVSQIPTSIAGTNSNNSFLSNNISNSFSGIYLYSYVDASTPFSLEDQNNVVSTTGSGRSSITNFGSSTSFSSAYGIYAYYQRNPVYSNTMINSNGGTVHSGTLYGIYNYSYYNNANVLITGDTVTLATSYAFAYIYGIYNYTYYGFDNVITNNVVTGCVNPTTSSYYSYYIYNYFAAGSNAYQNSLTMTGNKVIGNTYGTATATGGTYDIYCYDYCMSFVNISNNLDSGNTVLGTSSYLNYAIYSPGTTYNSKINNNRVVNNTFCGTTAASTTYGIYSNSGTFSAQIDSNVVANNTLPTTSTHSMYFMYNTSAAPSIDYSYNTVSGNTSSGAGTFYSLYYSATPGLGSVENLTNNTITNQSKTTATGTGSIYGIYKSGSGTGTVNLNNNTVTGFSSAAATLFAGIYQVGTPANYLNINNNKVGNFTNGGASTIYGIYNGATTTTQPVISQDSVFNIVSAGSTIYGLYMVNGNPVNIFKNRISGLSSNTSTTGTVYGIYISGGVINNIYDNIVSDLTAPASTSSPAVTGIYLSGGTYDNLYYNSVLLKAASTSVTTFGTAALYASTTPVVDLRNNVLIDSSSPGPSSNSVAYRRSSSTLTSYQTTSNNNCLYGGIPSATHLLFYDGINSVQTLAAYKSLMISRDNNSVTEYPPFVNSIAPPFDLRVKTTIGTQLESGAQVISTSGNPAAPLNITQDAFNVPRYPNSGYPVGGFTPTAPDMGANEFGGLIADVNGPLVVYTPLGIGGTSNRAFTNVAITDASGVNTTVGTKPRCYYKRSTDGNVINDNTSGTDGWKYVEATGSTNPFDFTIDYSKLNGGTGVIAGQSVLYFVVAQDLVGTPNVGWNQATFTTNPATVALVSGNAPITNTLSYTIGTATFSGAYNVGTAQTYTSLTGVGGMFAALNAGTISGNVTLNITSDLTEDGTNALNAANETGVGGYKITIVPASASVKTISGTVANGMIRFNGARRVTVDGNNGLGGKYLTFRNINGLNPTITFMNEAGRDTIKNCTIESNNATVTSGTVLFSTTTLGTGTGNDSICINSCDIRDRSDATGYPANGICSNGSVTTLQTYNNYNSIINCNIYNQYLDVASFQAGINLYAASTNWVISNNSIYQTAPKVFATAATLIGIFVNSSLCNDIAVTNNYVGGSAPLCAGSPLTFSGAGLYNYYGIYLFVGGLVPSSIQGNVVTNYNMTTNPASGSSVLFRGINVPTTAAWCNIGNLSGNTIGSGTGTGAITLSVNTTTTGYTTIGILSNGIGNISNNTVGSITVGGSAVTTTGFSLQGIQWSSTIPGWTYNCSNNLIGSLTTPNSMQLTDTLSPGGLRGFVFGNGAGTTNNLTNNVVANLTAFVQATTSNTVASATYGFSTSAAGNYNITNNTIYNLTVNSNAITPTTFLVSGIPHSSTGVNNISQNTMYSLVLNMTSTGAGTNAGMFVGGSQGTVVSRNKMYDLRYSASSISSSPNLGGIWVANATGPMTISNNMVSITNGDPSEYAFIKSQQQIKQHINIPFTDNQIPTGKLLTDNKEYRATDGNADEDLVVPVVYSAEKFESTIPTSKKEDQSKKSVGKDNVNSVNAAFVAGIITQAGGTQQNACSYYYNSVYVGGTQPGASTYGSYAFVKQFNTDLVLRNNLFVNARTGGTGNHYCIANETSPVYEGWPVTASNYNVLLGSNAATIGEWGAGVPQTLAQWIASSGGDKQTWSTTTSVVSPTSLFTNVAIADLSIQTGNSAAWLVSGKGIALSNVNNDFAGNPRVTAISSGCTDIGAFEFAATPPSNPVATVDNPPGSGVTSTYSLYGRNICSITWGAGGVYPATMNVNYFSGVNPLAPNVTTPNRSSNSYWTVVPGSGTFSGTTYNITLYYGDNETYTVTNPNTNILLAKNDLGYWMSYPAGSSAQQSNLNWAGYSVTTTGLPNFSSFTLTDAALPALSLVSPAYGSINQPQALTCVWRKFAGATTYRFQLSTDSLFNTLIYNDAALTDSTRAVSGLLTNTRYWWRVNAVNGVGTGAWSQVFKFNTISILPPAVVNLTVIPGGFYNTGTGTLNMKDTIRVYLVDSATCVKVDSTKILLDSVTFSASPNFSIANTGNYYIFVTHRNHVVISSRLKQTVTRGATVSYNFVSDSSNTYGNNVIKVSTSPVRWAMIPGDANQDQFVDGLDQSMWILQNGLDGYLVTDFNGDSFIDGLDQSVWILFNGNSSFLPCAFPDYYTNPDSKKHVVIDNRNTKQIFNNNSNQDTKKGNK